MPVLQLKHTTTYRYSQPVAIGEHRLMVRPRESHDQRLLDFSYLPGSGTWSGFPGSFQGMDVSVTSSV